MGDPALGLRLYEDGIMKGEMDQRSKLLYVYSVYLLNGGTPAGFATLTVDDITLMYATDQCLRMKQAAAPLELLAASKRR